MHSKNTQGNIHQCIHNSKMTPMLGLAGNFIEDILTILKDREANKVQRLDS